ncbi:MAG: peptidoglycan DD-metalloendopeptidase family protein [Rhodobacter sp.]|nr:peptidoglycan DD-metalloendopeptidase family protein [Rhodobacter sp.]
MNAHATGPRRRWLPATAALTVSALALAGCGSTSNLDWDLRPSNRFSTSTAAQQATAARPQPDARGVISYPGYQVVVANRGESVTDIANRLGLSPAELGRHNAIEAGAVMRGGELLVLPARVGDGNATTTITATPLAPTAPVADGPEPVRHTVRRGETAFSIARLYEVSPRSLADWNGLAADMSVREGQILVIPVAQTAGVGAPLNAAGVAAEPATPEPAPTSLPGQGSPTPVPPSASTPLPATTPTPAGQGGAAPVADMSTQRTEGARLAMPVDGRIIRAYARGRNDGVGIGAPAGTEVHAAAAGTVAAITRDTEQVPILVIRHENNLLTVYANIDDIRVSRGDRVTRGQTIATVRRGDPSYLHFEVREGFESVDPMPYLQ